MTRLLHLSDFHLNGPGEERLGIDADQSLRLTLEACAHVEDLSAVVVTGDVADDGSHEAYQRARRIVFDFAGPRAIPMFFCVGNHDARPAFHEAFGSGHLDHEGRERASKSGPADRVVASSVTAGLRIVTLDSLVPGKWYGSLGKAQLSWLRELLTDAPAIPTILTLHHPPITLGLANQERVGLEDREELAAVLDTGNVRGILCGHFHQPISSLFSGVPTWVTPGVFTRIDHLSGHLGSERAVAGGAATVVDLSDPAEPTFEVVEAKDPRAGMVAYDVSADELDKHLRVYGMKDPGVCSCLVTDRGPVSVRR